MAPPPGSNAAVARPELDFLHQVLGINRKGELSVNLKDVVFVCIDCEAFESQQKKITEVGVAVLDTKDIAGVVSGGNGENWIGQIKYAHYRPVEYAMKVNRRFVKGAEDQFAFGDTTWINLQDASEVLSRIFQCPERLSEAAKFEIELPDTKRNIVFVAHGLNNDDEYLNTLGFKLSQARNVARQVDSQRVAGGTKKNSLGLKRLLEKLGMQHQGLHNGGNDAAYTLQAVAVMAVKEFQQPGVVCGPNDLPAIAVSGPVRAPGVSATHVYGGTAIEGTEKLPLDGGKPAKKTSFKKKNSFAKRKREPPAEKAYSTTAPPNLGRHTVKRPTPDNDAAHEQAIRKRPAR